jgi:hypothetical protein
MHLGSRTFIARVNIEAPVRLVEKKGHAKLSLAKLSSFMPPLSPL